MSISSTNAVKGFFVILVFLSHFSSYLSAPSFSSVYNHFSSYMGQLIVAPFLFYSGYGIMASVHSKGAQYMRSFPKNRLLKFWTHFVPIIPLFLIVAKIIGTHYDITTIFLSLFAWRKVGNSNWYVFAILYLYVSTALSFVFLQTIFKTKSSVLKERILICFLFFFCLLYIAVIKRVQPAHWYDTIIAYPLGMLFFCCQNPVKKLLACNNCVYLTAVIIFLLSLICGTRFRYTKTAYRELYTILFLCFMVLLTLKVQFHNRLLALLGKYVFEVYALQRISMLLFRNHIQNPYLFFLVCVIVTALLARFYRSFTDFIDRKFYG